MQHPDPPVPPADPAWVHLGAPAPFGSSDLPPLDVAAALEVARTWTGPRFLTGGGSTLALWELLATTAAGDVAVARALEPTLDARSILDQARTPTADGAPGPAVDLPAGLDAASTWGVYAAEAPGTRLAASPRDGGWRLTGVKPWCSLAGSLEGGLVTAHLPDGERGLFAVDLRGTGVAVAGEGWVSRGLAEIPSTPVAFDDAPAAAVGAPGWYLGRPGFWWGGIGVAACWYGGAVGVARRVLEAARQAPEARAERLIGVVGLLDEQLADARRALAAGAAAVDGVDVDGDDAPPEPGEGRVLAKRVRATVARACDVVLREAADALGPAPLTQEEAHAKRVADLAIYVRQHHPWREAVSLGTAVVGQEGSAW
ncbi:acyl-CoA dehydrogenase [Serinibacter arcticus]|uniref:acyl-CoA dehydrogenase n=1 Tax=Serinibacter arcticus TaxID=1655435 RepID=UPI001304FB87|nr:acyl-CoA dehydrogenase [Serinibacter arcticus]